MRGLRLTAYLIAGGALLSVVIWSYWRDYVEEGAFVRQLQSLSATQIRGVEISSKKGEKRVTGRLDIEAFVKTLHQIEKFPGYQDLLIEKSLVIVHLERDVRITLEILSYEVAPEYAVINSGNIQGGVLRCRGLQEWIRRELSDD
jgi:hypothetical protein